jgi:hypothetical protein
MTDRVEQASRLGNPREVDRGRQNALLVAERAIVVPLGSRSSTPSTTYAPAACAAAPMRQ